MAPGEAHYSWPDSLAALASSNQLHNMTGPMGASLPGIDHQQMGNNSSLSMSALTRKDQERMLQWGYQETKDLIAIRSQLELDFTQTKRNKLLWETVSSKMKEIGYRRSAEQCKLKWKNLHNRYKSVGASTSMESCPFYEELHAIASEPRKSSDGLFMDSGKRGRLTERSCDDLSAAEDENEGDDSEDEDKVKQQPIKKVRKAESKGARVNADKSRLNNMQELLEDFLQQQQRVELDWMEALHRREEERKRRELEWREAMENLERERMLREQLWREREEQRRAREEMRAQKRDEVFSALLSMLAKRGT